MRQITVKVPDEQYMVIAREAASRKLSVSDLIRERLGIAKVDDEGKPIEPGLKKLKAAIKKNERITTR